MKYLLLLFAVVFLTPLPVRWTQPHRPIQPHYAQIVLPRGCSDADPCNDPSRPWMRGHIEKYCGKTAEQVKAMQDENPGATILKCECHHVCNASDPLAAENGGRTWDGACEARCNPKNCKCSMKCETH